MTFDEVWDTTCHHMFIISMFHWLEDQLRAPLA